MRVNLNRCFEITKENDMTDERDAKGITDFSIALQIGRTASGRCKVSSWQAVFVALAAIVLMLAPGLAFAQTEVFDNSISSCTAINCSSLTIPGSVLNFGPFAGVWNINVFARAGNCVRLDVISQSHDLEMVVVAPDGSVYRNDDRTVGDTRPLVKIGSVPGSGWYTVHIAQFAGASVEADFTLLFGHYSAGNPNCATPTLPFVQSRSSKQATAPETEGAKPPELGSPE